MYDLTVIGAGPAESSAARRAAQQGLSTLLIEKEKVPRHKLCGGGLTSKVLGFLDFKLPDTLVERTVTSTRIHVGQDSYPFETTRTLAVMTSRASFDAFLTEKALETGSY
jgi:flavin-dependent dehydrogenase